MKTLEEAKKVFDIEIEALEKTRDSLDETFDEILKKIIDCSGKVIITGMGKPGHIATKLAATFSSLGTPSFYLHPGEAMHGDLGMISESDVVIAISYSGESDEIITILPNIKLIGAFLIGITGNSRSTLAKMSDIVQILPEFEEACYLGLAPTSSTTAVLCYGDALAVVASGLYDFKDSDFGKFHPAGSLGKKILVTVDDLMLKDERNAVVLFNDSLKSAIVELSKKGIGIVSVVNDDNKLVGVVSDGDLRRQLERGVNIYSLEISEIMTETPVVIETGKMAIDALKVMKTNGISAMPVVKNGIVCGTIRLHDIINYGIVG